jgi:hypothetical protein
LNPAKKNKTVFLTISHSSASMEDWWVPGSFWPMNSWNFGARDIIISLECTSQLQSTIGPQIMLIVLDSLNPQLP